MTRRSAGILLHRGGRAGRDVLLVHPGGPLWRNRHEGAWQIPKGLVEPGEDEEAAARREVAEELGIAVDVPLASLGTVRQAGGKLVVAFAGEMDFDPSTIVSNLVEIAWPPRSGWRVAVPEVDEARWFSLEEGRRSMLPSQATFLDRLEELLGGVRPS